MKELSPRDCLIGVRLFWESRNPLIRMLVNTMELTAEDADIILSRLERAPLAVRMELIKRLSDSESTDRTPPTGSAPKGER